MKSSYKLSMTPLIERPKMTRSMYMALKRHIMRDREKIKQEQEQDRENERLRKERELKRKKEEQDHLTLEQTKEQISSLESKLEVLKRDKHDMFSQLKKILHEDDSRKRAREQSELMHMQQQYQQAANMQASIQSHHPMFMQAQTSPMPGGRPTLYNKPLHQQTQTAIVPGIKRGRSPSPPPSAVTMFQGYPKYASSNYSTATVKQEPQFNHAQQRSQNIPISYQNQSTPYQPSQQATVHSNSQSPASAKYPPSSHASQSAFSSYQYQHQQHQKQGMGETYPHGYPVRMSQQGYLPSSHGNSQIPLQQQLEHANQKSGFTDEKFKIQQVGQQLRGLSPLPPHQPAMVAPPGAPGSTLSHPTPPIQKGSIMSGYPVRTQPAPSSSNYPTPSSQGSYPQAQSGTPRTSYPSQQQGRYY